MNKTKRAGQSGIPGPKVPSRYAQKLALREKAPETTTEPLAATSEVAAERVEAVFWGISEFPRTLNGEKLFLPWRVLKQSGLWLRKRERILCEVTSPEPGHKHRMIVSLQIIA